MLTVPAVAPGNTGARALESGQPDTEEQGARRTNEDAEAMTRLAAGEMAALGEIYDRHHMAVRRFITHATGDADEADDLVHTTFLAVPKIARSFDVERSCRAWLIGIAARMIRRHRASGARWARMLLKFRHVQPVSSASPERLVMARREIGKVDEALQGMSAAKRVVLVMAELEGMSCEEIATALEIPIGTVWTRLHHARRILSAAIAPEEGT